MVPVQKNCYGVFLKNKPPGRRFFYGLNNPVKYVDPTGHLTELFDGSANCDPYDTCEELNPYNRGAPQDFEDPNFYEDYRRWAYEAWKWSCWSNPTLKDNALDCAERRNEAVSYGISIGDVEATIIGTSMVAITNAATVAGQNMLAPPAPAFAPPPWPWNPANDWAKATYDSPSESMNDHFNRHPGPWTTVGEYTAAANRFFAHNRHLGVPHPLRDGTMGIKITTGNYFGIYTNTGKIISFGLR